MILTLVESGTVLSLQANDLVWRVLEADAWRNICSNVDRDITLIKLVIFPNERL